MDGVKFWSNTCSRPARPRVNAPTHARGSRECVLTLGGSLKSRHVLAREMYNQYKGSVYLCLDIMRKNLKSIL